ncbi:MAG TPA: HAD family hydrolase [Solirubrobacteraceae bacterium]|nr:HAD family hydrolase [Solirubrobacteraceae bacterium]
MAVFDIDGTLVDTNYQHAIAWYRAFRAKEIIVPIWRIHRAIGMGSDRVVSSLLDEQVEHDLGDALRDLEKSEYQRLIDEVEPMNGAHELLAELKGKGHPIILASSAEQADAERYIELLGASEFVDAYTTSADVRESKPEPDIVNAAIEKAGGGSAVMVGDSSWDCKAATRANVPSIAVLTGGFSEQELIDAGATVVFDSVEHLRLHLHDTTLSETVAEP